SMIGIHRSRRISQGRSGPWRRTSASRPLAAPATRKPASSSKACVASRAKALSSTTRMNVSRSTWCASSGWGSGQASQRWPVAVEPLLLDAADLPLGDAEALGDDLPRLEQGHLAVLGLDQGVENLHPPVLRDGFVGRSRWHCAPP